MLINTIIKGKYDINCEGDSIPFVGLITA